MLKRERQVATMVTIAVLLICSGCKKTEGLTESTDIYSAMDDINVTQEEYEKVLNNLDNLINIRYNGNGNEVINRLTHVDDISIKELHTAMDMVSNERIDLKEFEKIAYSRVLDTIENGGGIINEDGTIVYKEIEPRMITFSESEPNTDVVYNNEESNEETDRETDRETEGTSENEDNIVGISDEDNREVDDPEEADLRLEDIYNSSGEKVWYARTEKQAAAMTPDENQEFDRILKEAQDSFSNQYKQVMDNIKDKSTPEIDTGDADLETPDEIRYNNIKEIKENQSEFIKYGEDGQPYISWDYAFKNFNTADGRLYFTLWDSQFYVEIEDYVIPISVCKGNEAYNFTRDNWTLVGSDTIRVVYKSYINEDEKYVLRLTFKLDENGNINLIDNIGSIFDIYE